MRTLLAVFSFCFFCCSPKEERKLDQSNNNKIAVLNNVGKIDSLKWLFYAFNFHAKALFFDTNTRSTISVNPVECGAIVGGFKNPNKDSQYYYFSFVKPGYVYKNLNTGSIHGFGLSHNNIYPVEGDMIFDYQKSLDSIKSHIVMSDSLFRVYLKSYKGNITSWLKIEARRRNILL